MLCWKQVAWQPDGTLRYLGPVGDAVRQPLPGALLAGCTRQVTSVHPGSPAYLSPGRQSAAQVLHVKGSFVMCKCRGAALACKEQPGFYY